MKSRRYLNVGPLHEAKPGEFFDYLVQDFFTEHEIGRHPETDYAPGSKPVPPSKIIEFPPKQP